MIPNDETLSLTDQWLAPYRAKILARLAHTRQYASRVFASDNSRTLTAGYSYFGLHRTHDGWVYRDWLPAASNAFLIGEFSDWKDDERFALHRNDKGDWSANLPLGTLKHGDHYKLRVHWPSASGNSSGERIPAYATYVVQDPKTQQFDAVVWDLAEPYEWHDDGFAPPGEPPLIYEAHVGMSGEEPSVSSYVDFAKTVIPRIKAAGYNTVQLMATLEHPYYGSFGYHVSSFFAPSSRFGTPDEFKYLVDMAHTAGLRVIIDLVHSHAAKNEVEGLSRYDGTLHQFFYDGERGNHQQWDSRVFDYGKPEVTQFLLSNCRYWLEEFHVDGFRFDGVTSMLYTHHGMDKAFTSYDDYFADTDSDAAAYLTLVNMLIHDIKPTAITIAEDMSGMPGLVASIHDGGFGFDYRLSMGVPDLWIRYIKEVRDDDWNMTHLFHELTQHRPEERTISYAESHDQALVGDKTLMFRLADKDMYDHMSKTDANLTITRAVALHKMIRLLTASLNQGGYLNFMGNEFGHPEWIDFPREGNDWSYAFARRQWSLADDDSLLYSALGAFDKVMITLLSHVATEITHVSIHDDNHTLSYARGEYVFAFNFHPVQSYRRCSVPAVSGDYSILLSTDANEFGGMNRIDTTMTYPANDGHLELYLPARTAVVLKRR